jgi:hypothetical protein
MERKSRPQAGDGFVDPLARGPSKPTDITTTSQRARRAKQRASAARWKAEHPLEIWAHQALASAIKRGLIQREACEICGKPEADAHHDDYHRPLAIRWMCRRHHLQFHAAQRKQERDG